MILNDRRPIRDLCRVHGEVVGPKKRKRRGRTDGRQVGGTGIKRKGSEGEGIELIHLIIDGHGIGGGDSIGVEIAIEE